MHYFFKPHEENFKEWVKGGFEGIPELGKDFLIYINSPAFKPKLKLFNKTQWKMQVEAIQRCVYSFEVLSEKDLLVNIVTGGGKTTIIGALIAYMMTVHDKNKFLLLTPNTIVRSRLVDDFNRHSETFLYDVFPFLTNSYKHFKDRIELHVMEPKATATGVRNANIIIGNIHQIYERTDNWKIIQENIPEDELVIFNDEAHNTKAELYDKLLYKLHPKRFFRLDTTATPDRLDMTHPDSKMIYIYTISDAMRDKIIKRVVVFHPDVKKVKLEYIDLETGETISAEDMPWEEIERKPNIARRYITAEGPMKQQIVLALELLKEQWQRVPRDRSGNPKFKPLLFVVGLSIADAERIRDEIKKVGKKYDIKNVLLVTNKSEEEKKIEAREINKNPLSKWDAIVSVLMLREGWDVRNISVILLFRKFCYKKVDGQIFSVYGPQVIGRGMRRMSKSPEEWENLFVIDHPILKHKWLWDHLKATEYPESLDPAHIIIDEEKIPEEKIEKEEELDIEQAEKKLDISSLPPTPDPPKVVEPIYEWQKFLDKYKYDFHKMNIIQDIAKIKSLNLDSELTTLQSGDIPKVGVRKIAYITRTESWNASELIKQLVNQIHDIAYSALLEYDRNPDQRQAYLIKVIREHVKKRLLLGKEIEEANEKLLRRLWALIDQVRDLFLKPELIEGILAQND